MAEKEFLDLPGLASYDGFIKTHITEKIQELADGEVKTNKDTIERLNETVETNKENTDKEVSALKARLFVGTYAEFQTAKANGEVAIGAIVIITDDIGYGGGDVPEDPDDPANPDSPGGDSGDDETEISTTSELGKAVLGYMILG